MKLAATLLLLALPLLPLPWLTSPGFAAEKAAEPADPFAKALHYRSIGPAAGGRASRAVGVPGDPLTFYVATAQGGVWKSVDGGHRWAPIFDGQPIASIGSIAVAPSDPNVVYVGSGEANIRGNVAPGNGIYRSTDAGKSWTHVWKQVGQIGTMIVHPDNPDVAFAAVLGHAFGPNAERGVYRTEDGGKSWQQVLKVDADTGASDVAFDLGNPRILFAGTWPARRYPWGMTSGGPGGGLWRSVDGGETWKKLEGSGLPGGIWGKVGVAVAPSDSRRVYALIENAEGGLYRSDDGGESWKWVNPHRALRQRAWYYSTLTVHPKNADVVWFPQVPMLRTIDGGKTIHNIPGFDHGDHHDLWIDPVEPNRLVNANDGGVELSVDGGKTWWAPRLPISQFYNIDVDDREPYHVGGTMQDLGTASGPSRSFLWQGIPLGSWLPAGGGEAGDFVFDRAEEGIAYAGEYGGIMTVHSEKTGVARNVSIYPTNPSGHGGEDLRVRFQWTAPLAVSPHDPTELYHGANVLFRSRDRGQTWQAISPDLTTNDKSKQKWSGGPITGDNTGVEIYCTIFSLALSPLERGLIWAGTDDGLVHLTRDDGKTWVKVTPPGSPAWGTVEGIWASRFAAGTAYVAVDAHRLDDPKPYVFKTTDYGKTWTTLTSGLAADSPVYVVKEDTVRPELLFAGHERGVAVSHDGGKSWRSLQLNLPTVAVTDLEVKGNDLVLGTRGRSIWVLDDFSPLRGYDASVRQQGMALLGGSPARRWGMTWTYSLEGYGENPPYGAGIVYHLKDKPKGELVLEITDAQGRMVKKLTSTAEKAEYGEDDPDEPTRPPKPALEVEPGLHRVTWNLAYAGAERLERAKVDLGDPQDGLTAPPGRYRLKLTADGQTAEGEVIVLPDPRSPVLQAALDGQLEKALAVRETLNRNIRAIRRVRAIREQAAELAGRLAGNAEAATLVAHAKKAIERCDALEAKLHNPKAEVVYDILAFEGGTQLYSKLVFVYVTLLNGDGPPTQGVQEVYAELLAELAGYERELADLEAKEVADLEAEAKRLALPRIVVE